MGGSYCKLHVSGRKLSVCSRLSLTFISERANLKLFISVVQGIKHLQHSGLNLTAHVLWLNNNLYTHKLRNILLPGITWSFRSKGYFGGGGRGEEIVKTVSLVSIIAC